MKFKRIKDLREDNDKLQREVAAILGISQQYYSEYEKGNRTIPITHLMTLAKFYGTLNRLYSRSNRRKRHTK